MEYRIEKNALTPEVYEHLREKVSLQHYEREDVEEALAHTLFSVVVKEGGNSSWHWSDCRRWKNCFFH